jgi:hypothetical protein
MDSTELIRFRFERLFGPKNHSRVPKTGITFGKRVSAKKSSQVTQRLTYASRY